RFVPGVLHNLPVPASQTEGHAMSGDLLTAADEDIEIEPEPEVEIEIEPESEAVPTSEPAAAIPENVRTDRAGLEVGALVPARGLVEVLPADFKLPALIKFIPNPALRIAADQAGTYALGLAV